MSHENSWREKAREVIQAADLPSESADHMQESRRLFELAAQCVGSKAALVQHLGLTHSELRTYLSGEAMPPEEVLLRALELVSEDSKPVQINKP